MKKVFIVLIIAIVAILTLDVVYFKVRKKVSLPKNGQIILFYGNQCPHCVELDQYLQKNHVEERISFIKKEVYQNKANQYLLLEKAEQCGMRSDVLGVPFLWAASKCYIGSPEIIHFFKEKMNEKK